MKLLLVFIIVAILWALIAFQKKILLNDFNFLEVGLGNFTVIIIFVFLLYPILTFSGNFNPKRLLNINRKQAYNFLICGTLVFAGGIGINYLLTSNDATTIIPMLKAGMILTTLFFGFLIYGERFTTKKVLASVLAIVAILILFYDKK